MPLSAYEVWRKNILAHKDGLTVFFSPNEVVNYTSGYHFLKSTTMEVITLQESRKLAKLLGIKWVQGVQDQWDYGFAPSSAGYSASTP